jgi:hypothetical protein
MVSRRPDPLSAIEVASQEVLGTHNTLRQLGEIMHLLEAFFALWMDLDVRHFLAGMAPARYERTQSVSPLLGRPDRQSGCCGHRRRNVIKQRLVLPRFALFKLPSLALSARIKTGRNNGYASVEHPWPCHLQGERKESRESHFSDLRSLRQGNVIYSPFLRQGVSPLSLHSHGVLTPQIQPKSSVQGRVRGRCRYSFGQSSRLRVA